MTLEEKLQKLEQVVLRARAHFDIWWVYAGAGTRPRVLPTMNEFSEFFRFDEHAHQFAFVIYLCQLLERRAKTINLGAVIAKAQASGYPAEVTQKVSAIAGGMEPTWKKLVILRSNLFAHRTDQLGWDETFSRAGITANEIRTFTGKGLTAVHTLLGVKGSHLNQFTDDPERHVLRLLDALANPS